MDPKEQAKNFIKNSCRLYSKYLAEPSNVFLDDIRAQMAQNITKLEDEKNREIDSNQNFSESDLIKLQQDMFAFDKVFYYKCNSNYTEADHNISWAFLSAGDSAKVFQYLDAAIYSLSKAAHHWSGALISKANWKEKVMEFCKESFKRNNIATFPEWKSKILNPGQFPTALVEDWLQMWESQSQKWIDDIFEE